ncbi:MAG TPA: precorrin-3B C(17)-methyltransferase [Nitrospiria bacterium]|nr:precorrin-3B C(17)-methyltransferase [Nitrospiria bacterium]
MTNKGELFLVGFGPGNHDHLTFKARDAIARANVVVGYRTYIDLVADLLDGKEVISTGMTEEIDRARSAVERARSGDRVALVSSGDVGVYGMAGLVFEILSEMKWDPATSDFSVEVIPGITALSAVSSLIGAGLTHDFVAISLSDLLTPWPVIEKRLHAAGEGDFVIALYNPQSKRRDWQLSKSKEILLKYKKAETPVAVVKSACREGQKVVVTTLEQMDQAEVGMLTTILIGNDSTFRYLDFIITPRGYSGKYDMESGEILHKGIDRPGLSLNRPPDFKL